MPTYEYVCKNCGYEFEKFQQMTEDHLKTCPECGKDALKRKIGAGSGVIFVGSGFYCNDYKGANASPDVEEARQAGKEGRETVKLIRPPAQRKKHATKETEPCQSISNSKPKSKNC